MQTQEQLTLHQALQLATQELSQGYSQQAESICQRILQAVPLQPEALDLLHQMDTCRLQHYQKILHEEDEAGCPRQELLPNFVVIGAMKCGTTSLYHYLREHPDIYLPEYKEHGIYLDADALTDKVRTQFDMLVSSRKEWADILVRRYNGEKMIGDASTYYTKFPFQGQGVPEIMHILKPEARIIYLVRNPVERILSHYLHSLDFGPNHLSLETFLRRHLSLPLNTSLYHFQLRRFVKLFGMEQVKVVTLEELEADAAATIRDIFKFLGVDAMFRCANLQEIHNASRSRSKLDAGHLLFPRDIFDEIMPFIDQDVIWLEELLHRRFDEWDFSSDTWTLN